MDLAHIATIINNGFDHYLYPILFILLFIEEAGVPLPLPGDIYVFLAGTQVARGHANVVLVLIDTVVASLLGSSVLFLLVKYKGEPLVEKYGKYIHITPAKLERGKHWFAKYGEAVVLVGRWIPGLRIVLSVVAGLFQLEYYKFFIAIGISSFFWTGAFMLAGMGLMKQKFIIISFFHHIFFYSGYIIYILSVAGIMVLLYSFSKRRDKQTSHPSAN